MKLKLKDMVALKKSLVYTSQLETTFYTSFEKSSYIKEVKQQCGTRSQWNNVSFPSIIHP
jgi:hypothetical protein